MLPPPYAFIGQVKKIIPCATQLDLWAVSLDIPDNELPRNLDPNEHHVMWKMTWGSEDVVVEAINYAGFGSPELLEVWFIYHSQSPHKADPYLAEGTRSVHHLGLPKCQEIIASARFVCPLWWFKIRNTLYCAGVGEEW